MKRRLKLIACAVILPLGAVVVLALFLAQPLLPSTSYVVTATANGAPTRVELLRPIAIPGIYYVHLPEMQHPYYRWFGIAFSRQAVFLPICVYSGWGGIRYVHTDQTDVGVNVTDGKLDAPWKVSFTDDGALFSNASCSISLRSHR